MLQFGCDLREQIYDEGDLSLYRGVLLQDRRSILLKVTSLANRRRIAELRHEQRMTQRLAGNCTLPLLGFYTEENLAGLLFEDVGGVPLSLLLAGPRLDTNRFLQIAQGICNALLALHAAGFLHKNLSPRSIWLNPETFETRLLDLGIASPLDHEVSVYRTDTKLSGQLPYMAPEQTGRMNRGID